MGLFRAHRCSACGKELRPGANFCPYCGTRVASGQVICGFCGTANPADARNCMNCGRELASEAPPTLVGNRWAKGPDDFAVRIEVDDVPGFLRKTLVIEAGTRALFLVGGRNIGEVGPGEYTLDALLGRLGGLGEAKRATVVLVEAGDVSLPFEVADVYTKDPAKMTLRCQLVIRVANPGLFLINMMRDRRTFTLTQLREQLAPELHDAVQEFVRDHSLSELMASSAFKDEMAMHIEAHLNRTFERCGLRMERVRTFEFRHEGWEEIQRLEEQQGRELTQMAKEAAFHEQRAQVLKRLQEAILSERMNEVRTEEELDSFLHEHAKRTLIRENEFEELKRAFAERKQDHEMARAHLLAKLQVEQEYELRLAEAAKRGELLQVELEQERRRAEGQLAIEELKWRHYLRRLEEQRRLEREQEREDAIIGIEMLEKIKRVKREDELERLRAEQELRIRLAQEYSQVSTEALIAVSPLEQAKLLAELKRTEAMKGLSEEQILAMAAERSPEIVRAFRERWARMDIAEQQQAIQQLAEITKQNLLSQQTIAASVGYRGAQQPPGIYQETAQPASMTNEAQICRRCHTKSPVGTRFCSNCGEAFF